MIIYFSFSLKCNVLLCWQQVVGPYANEAEEIYGDYSPLVSRQFVTTVAEGLVKLAVKVDSASGCDDVKCGSYSADVVTKAVDGADLVVVALGTGRKLESEGNDRSNIDFPGRQFELLLDAVRVGKLRLFVSLTRCLSISIYLSIYSASSR